MKFLRVVGWEKYQHYKNRRAPWIKAHTGILDRVEHPKYTELSDGAKLTLQHLRLLAGVTGNRIEDVMLNRDRLNMKTPPRVDELIAAGFAEWFDGASEHAQSALASTDENEGADASARPLRARSRPLSRALSGQGNTGISPESGGNEKQKPLRARELVEDFAVTDHLRAWAAEKAPGVDVDAATESWRDHFRHNGYRTRAGPICDADAAWRNWMRNEVKFRGRNGPSGNDTGPRPTPGATGRNKRQPPVTLAGTN
jgi:hypothetical protein